LPGVKAIIDHSLVFMKRLSTGSKIEIIIIIAALLLALFPPPASFVERFYSRGLYPWVQRLTTPLTNLAPFAIVDALLFALFIGLPAWWIIRIVRAGRGRRGRAAGRLLFDSLAFGAALFLAFEFLWGLNYVRIPIAAKVDYDEARLTDESLKQLARSTIAELNLESPLAPREDWPAEAEWRRRLHQSLDDTVGELGHSRGIAPGIPKHSLLDPYLAAAGIDGFVNPFGLEVIVDSELLQIEKPFTLAHEWAHLAGFADESEASFVGLLACLRSDAAAIRYSGLLALYQHLPWRALDMKSEMNQDEQALHALRLSMDVIADLRAIRERADRRVNPEISKAQARVYDQFLKANRVQAGIASYGLMLRLVLGTRFEQEWVPARRQ
jgi:uncharacterized protein DUF3810